MIFQQATSKKILTKAFQNRRYIFAPFSIIPTLNDIFTTVA